VVAAPRCSSAELASRRPEAERSSLPERLDYLAIGGRAVWLRQQAGGVYDPMPDVCNH
jgi:hypothetical protein